MTDKASFAAYEAPALLGPELTEASKPAVTASPAFKVLYAEEFDFVWRNLRRLGVQESALRDATQDVFLVVYRRLDAFEPRAPIRAWLFSIARRVALHYRRGQQRQNIASEEDTDALPATLAGPDEHVADSQALQFLLSLLEELDDDRRVVFVLSELEEMTAAEIAATLGCNINTVYSRLRSAREKVRALYRRRQGRNRGQ